jgi:hypothetical protein
MRREQEAVKRSDGYEPMWLSIHGCMKGMLGISLYSYLYLQLPKMLHLSYYLLFSLQQNWRRRGQNRFFPEVGEGRNGEVAQKYIHT